MHFQSAAREAGASPNMAAVSKDPITGNNNLYQKRLFTQYSRRLRECAKAEGAEGRISGVLRF